jgi:hypothetical protein
LPFVCAATSPTVSETTAPPATGTASQDGERVVGVGAAAVSTFGLEHAVGAGFKYH